MGEFHKDAFFLRLRVVFFQPRVSRAEIPGHADKSTGGSFNAQA